MITSCLAHRVRTLSAAAALGVLVLSVGSLSARQAKATPPPEGQSIPDMMQWYQAQPRLSQPVFTTGAKVMIVKFTDLECPGCGLTHEAYKPVLAKYEAQFPGAVKLVAKDFPLNKDCNIALQRTLHESACEAAIAVRLAAGKGHANELEDFFYRNQRVMTPDTVRRAASLVANVGTADFQSGRAAAMQAIRADIELARSIDITSTPTFVFNGVRVPKVMEPALFDALVAFELRRAGVMR
ncbi:MAG: DsbA family protein [Bacteroidales bacterium]